MATKTAEKRSRNAVSLLSLDSGGSRGISQLEILKQVMDKLSGDANGDFVKRPCEVFAMIGGTGTGGLIAILLAVLEMTADQALETFIDFTSTVFKNADSNPIKQNVRLKQAISDILNKYEIPSDAKLVAPGGPAPGCKLFLPVFDKKNTGSLINLANYVDRRGPPTNLTIAEAMLATCADPPYFSPVKVTKDFSTVEYIAASHGLSNPIREIIDGAYRAFGGDMPVICLLSIGSGHPGVNPAPDSSQVTPHLTFLEGIATDSERTAQAIASQMEKLTLYHRLSVAYGMEILKYQTWKEPEDIIAQTRTYLGDGEAAKAMNKCINTLKDGTGFTTLEYLKFSGGAEVLTPELLELTPNYVERKAPTEFLEGCVLDEQGRIKGGSKRIIVTGMGGCGKTQLVRKFIEDHSDQFATAFFVDGSSEETLKRDIIQHVRSLGDAHSQKSFKEAMQFLSRPAQDGERLLVIDNADDPKVNILPFLPRWKRGTVILTSRNASHGQLGPSSHLKLDEVF
ncbi:hypothetical protein M408DRAFT_30105 [Serendipita vermifera MAFF 305830]|uniref:PNPLA domain-containing protein n=1 Tax=Serendipita vermifera MAFF 305830 TaxID=933852 RepID=A0A0C2W2S4_SERVB|nr:hypothetical protein M408DRAFT_30105 [Serendipita vermifera MAFF 305830]